MAGFIDDGYVRKDGYIAAAPLEKNGERLWDAVTFSYRVAARKEVIRLDAKVEVTLRDVMNDPECALRAEDLACTFVAERVTEWSVKNRGGHPVPINADTVGRLAAPLFGSMYRIVRGSQLSDPKPPETILPPSDEELEKNSAGVLNS